MKKLLLALATLAPTVANANPNVQFRVIIGDHDPYGYHRQIYPHPRHYGYYSCRMWNGERGILAYRNGRPVTRWNWNPRKRVYCGTYNDYYRY
jgi:hypothetical protein